MRTQGWEPSRLHSHLQQELLGGRAHPPQWTAASGPHLGQRRPGRLPSGRLEMCTPEHQQAPSVDLGELLIQPEGVDREAARRWSASLYQQGPGQSGASAQAACVSSGVVFI